MVEDHFKRFLIAPLKIANRLAVKDFIHWQNDFVMLQSGAAATN